MRILFAATMSDTINAFLGPHIRMLVEDGHRVDVAFRTGRKVHPGLREMGCAIHETCFDRNPLSFKNLAAYSKVKKLIDSENYGLVHAHTPVASFITRLACRNRPGIKVLYTAHGLHFFRGAPLRNWVFYFPLEWWMSKYTDVLITINKEDYSRAKRLLRARAVYHIPGAGLDLEKIRNTAVNKAETRKELGVPEDALLLVSAGELNRNKNHEVVIRALAELNMRKIYYVVCGSGKLEGYLKKLALKLGVSGRVKFPGYRNDAVEIFKSSDVFLLPSKREGLGMAALEAMACGLPIIASAIHGIRDYSVDGATGFACAPGDVRCFRRGIARLAADRGLRARMGENGAAAAEKCELRAVLDRMRQIYREASDGTA